jgi:hypothetical protein
VVGDCLERFAQRQALNRHIETKHNDARNATRFYHCTVDGCKYSSSGRGRKRFARADQVKEHIKEYGHYGPHSANNRPRRAGERHLTIHAITAWFEEWSVDENVDLQPRRTVQSCVYDSFKTMLWHTDVAADIFLRGDEARARDAHKCLVEGCYYHQLGPPEGCETVVFKTAKDLQEHHRRAHESDLGPLLATQVGRKESGSIVECSSAPTDSHSSKRLPLNSDLGYSHLDFLLLGMDNSGADHTKSIEWSEMAGPALSDCCSAGEGVECYCQACCQRVTTTTQQQSESMVPQVLRAASDIEFSTLSSSSSMHYIDFQLSDTTTDTENYQFGLPACNSTSLFRHDSLKARSK